MRDAETGQTGLGGGTPAGSAFVADFTAGTRGRAGVWRNRRRVVMGLHLHQYMRVFPHIAVMMGFGITDKHFGFRPRHHRGVIAVRRQNIFFQILVISVAYHRKQRFGLGFAVYSPVGVKDFVAAMFGVGLGEHHQLHIGGVALQLAEAVIQVVDFIYRQR